jgi:HPt (histidine-containing phosphotransfer) domain-containing protein
LLFERTQSPHDNAAGDNGPLAPPPEPQPQPQDDVLNYDVLLENCLGDASLLISVVAQFEQQARTDLHNILRALAGADIDGVRAAAHSLKGAAGYLTAQRLRSAAQRLELAARPGWMKLANQLATELVRQLQDCLGRLREFVERAKSESPPPIGASGADADSAVAKGNPG